MTAIAQLPRIKSQLVHVKSKYGAECRRFSITPLNDEQTKLLLEKSNSDGSSLLQSTTPQLPAKNHNTQSQSSTHPHSHALSHSQPQSTPAPTSSAPNGHLAPDPNHVHKSSRSTTSKDSSGSSKSATDHKKLMRLKGITFAEFQLTLARLHRIEKEVNPIDNNLSFKIFYNCRKTGTLLPINNGGGARSFFLFSFGSKKCILTQKLF